jgi:hypothetical protein
MISAIVAFLILTAASHAHQAIYHPAMWCFNVRAIMVVFYFAVSQNGFQGTTSGVDNPNTNDAVNPLFNLTKSEWWMHHVNNAR